MQLPIIDGASRAIKRAAGKFECRSEEQRFAEGSTQARFCFRSLFRANVDDSNWTCFGAEI
jgi:hypothetical protein